MTPNQRDNARHALGLPNQRGESYRNRFVTGPGSSDHADWLQMMADGNATRYPGSQLTGGDDFFVLTAKGANAALNKGERLDPENFPQKAAS